MSEALVMSELLRNAEECRRMANNSIREQDKIAWLRLAEAWLELAQERGGRSQFAWASGEDPHTRH